MATFNIKTKSMNDTATLHLVDPVTEMPLYADEAEKKPLQIKLNGRASKVYKNALSAMLKKSSNRKGKSSFEQSVADNNGLLSEVSVEALNFDMGDGVPIKTAEQFLALYSEPSLYWVQEQVNAFLQAPESFSTK